jgi:hypothetical protein
VITAYWLLEVTIDGRTFRWSTTRVVVDAIVYQAGLEDLQAEVGTDQVSVSIVDPSVDWPSLAPAADGGSAVLRRWRTDQAIGQAIEITSGELRVESWGARDDAFVATILRTVGTTLGTAVPDVTSTITSETWPDTDPGSVMGDEGRIYPVILGYPGRIDEDTLVPVVPLPLGQWNDDSTLTIAIVAEDGSQSITSAAIYNAATGGTTTETVSAGSDQLGHSIRFCGFQAGSPAWPLTSDQPRELYAAFSLAGGGGPRTAYEVLVSGLQRWARESADWSRLPEVQAGLERFLVDTWIDAGQADFWSWYGSALLPFLPYEIRVSARGHYLVETRYASDPRRQVRSISADRGEATIASAISLSDGGPYNEFAANYRHNREGDPLGRILLTGRDGVVSARELGANVDALVTTAVRSELCSRSESKYGARPAPVLELDWCWDEGTAIEVLSWMAERDALPARMATYTIPDGDTLREGQEVSLTDTPRGLVGAAAIVTGPPLLTSTGAVVDFRIPA